MKLFFYDLAILCYEFGAWLLSPINIKARLWLRGRMNWPAKLRQKIKEAGFDSDASPVVWLHASSLGEFEQGRPLLDAVRRQYPNVQIVVTFFSPSGYQVRKDFKEADIVCYLPTDTPANAVKFIQMINPSLALWVKYEYWHHHLKSLHKKNIPVLLVSGAFRPQQAFFKWYGGFHRAMLQYFRHFFVITAEGAKLLESILPACGKNDSCKRITVSGDTRFDRVITIAEKWEPVLPLEEWLKPGEKVVVAGSTWRQDEEELVHFVKANPGIRFIIAPHQVAPDLLKESLELFPEAIFFSDLLNNSHQSKQGNVLIINNVGILSRIYRYGTVCYIGGGFTGTGIHNVLEAAVYGRPIVHGPEYERYPEAIDLQLAGGSFSISNALELEAILKKLLTEEHTYERAAKAAKAVVYAHQGSTQKIMDYIQANRLLTSL